jgi:von Willebrand factor type A domain/Trypsin-like peptidase domain
MSHFLGPVVREPHTFDQTSGLDLKPRKGTLGGPRFVILHFDNVNLIGNAKLTVELGYDTDVFDKNSGSSFWSRPVDTSIAPIQIRITGGTGSALLLEYGAGEPSVTPGTTAGQPCGSQTNPDPFLQTDPYQEPIFETRLKCSGATNPDFAWENAACLLPPILDAVRNRVAAATGIIIEAHRDPHNPAAGHHLTSCSGTLIAADLFLTARHCLNDPSGEDVRTSSVTFDYATACDGTKPAGHVTRFFKVIGEVASGGPPTGVGDVPPVATDWVIVRLDAAPGALPPPLEMRSAALMNGEAIFTMHHPNGAVKKAQARTYGGGTFITGFDYAGGSSGSALFDINGLLVGGPLSQGGSCFSPGTCSVTYAPIANIIAALANPPPPPKPLDVMIVFDRSGSMSSSAPPIGRTKLQEAQDAASLFVQLVREGAGDQLGMVTFSSQASVPTSLGLVAGKKTEMVGPAPFTTGDIGAITAGGSTSIGAGLGIALLAFGASSANDHAILLLTDGLQNTAPMVEEIEGFLGGVKLNVIGFGSDADIDGPLLSRVSREHGGQFTRAVDGLALRKFFGLAFGNIFEAGALGDPESILHASQAESEPHKFSVCGEEHITVVLGWDEPSTPLRARILTPSGKPINERQIRPVRGRTWVFWKIPLPHQGERDGTWSFTVDRVPSGEFPPPPTDVRYFFLVVCSGGPKLVHLGGPRRVYTGDPLDSLVGLHYRNGTSPPAEVNLIIKTPTVALGQLVMNAGLLKPAPSGDAVSGFYATLQSVARNAGGVLPVAPSTITVPLFDDGSHDDGAMEPDGIYNNRLKDLTRVEGTYEFRAVATFGEECTATREAFWSVHVEPAIDPERSDVKVVDVTDQSDGRHGTLVITPRDPYGNPLGPGRGDHFTVSPIPGVQVTGNVKDLGDGSYGVNVVWDPSVTPTPGVLINQPDRNPAIVTPPDKGRPPKDCSEPAEDLLDCLGLKDSEVKTVRVKSVCVEIDLKSKGLR